MKREQSQLQKREWLAIKKISQQGFSLIEIILSLALLSLFVTALAGGWLYGQEASRLSGSRLQAILYAEEGLEAVRNIRDESFNNLSDGNHGLAVSGNEWGFSGTQDINGDYTRQITISTVDSNRKDIISTITWQQNLQRSGVVSLATRLARWAANQWFQTTQADFNAGTRDSVIVTNVTDGEVELGVRGDWVSSTTQTTFSTDGDGNINDFAVDTRRQILYTVSNTTTGDEFMALDISDISNGNITEVGSVSLNVDAFAISLQGDYAFITTASDTSELVVIRLTDYTQVNTFDVPTGSDAVSIYTTATSAYVGTLNSGDEEFYELNISNPEGTITQLGAVEIGDDVNGVGVSGGYAFLATNLNNAELDIVRLSDYTVVNGLDLSGNTNANNILIDGNVLYLTRQQSVEAEFYALNISTPETTVPILGSDDIGGDGNAMYLGADGNMYVATSDNNKEMYIFSTLSYTEIDSQNLAGNNTAQAIVQVGSYAYIGTDSDTTEVNAVIGGQGGWSLPQQVGTYNTSGNIDANDVFVVGDYSYVVTNTNNSGNEFNILDISTPATPVFSGSLEIGADVHHVFVVGNYAYLATGDSAKELIVVNITNKSAPTEAGSFDITGTEDALTLFVDGTTVYIGTQDKASGEEFYVLNAGTPAAIVQLGSYEIGADVQDIEVNVTSAYLATSSDTKELIILDITTPSTISEEDFYDATGISDAFNVAYSNNTAYLVRDNGATDPDFHILNVDSSLASTDWTNPQSVGFSDISGTEDANSIFKIGNYIYEVTDEKAGALAEFYIYDVSIPSAPSLVGSLNIGASVNDVYVVGNYAYLATTNNSEELVVVDISVPATPVQVGSYDTPNRDDAYTVFAVGSTVYIGTDRQNSAEFYVLNASNPASITQSGSYEVGDHVNEIFVSGNYAYIASASNSKEFIILNISNAASITEEDSYNISGNTDAEGIYYSSGTAYLVTQGNGGGDDFFIFNISTPSSIALTGSANLSSINNDVVASGNYAFVATDDTSAGITIVDITTLSSPVEYGNYNSGAGFNGVVFDGTYAYGASQNNNRELDIITASSGFITLLSELDLNSTNTGVVLGGDYAYVSTTAAGEELTVVNVLNTSLPLEFGVYDATSAANDLFYDGTYVYLATVDNSLEFQIVGPQLVSTNKAYEGWFTSSEYDSAASNTVWNSISWTVSGSGTLQFQLRTAPDSGGSPGTWTDWLGPSGATSFYTTSGGHTINTSHRDGVNDQWIQYRAFFIGDGTNSPVLEDITIGY